jgi:negative regulator of sigma E activity
MKAKCYEFNMKVFQMKCKKVFSLLSSYIDDEVSSEERKKIEAHLKECQDCSNSLHELRETVGLLGDLEEAPVPPELAEKIKAGIREEERKKVQQISTEKGQKGIFPNRALSYILVFSGIMVAIIAVIIPLRTFWSLQTVTKRVIPKSEKSLGVRKQPPLGTQQDETRSGKTAESFDSIAAGEKVKVTAANYNEGGVKKLLDFCKEREEQKPTSEIFSSQTRDETISSMLNEAKNLKLNVSHFEQCFGVLMAQNENILPVYAEKTRFKDKEVWIIVVKEFLPGDKGAEMKAFVLGTPVCELIFSTD